MIEFLRLILHIMASLFKNEARGRNPNPSPTAQRASPTGIEATTTEQYRSLAVCLALSLVSFRPQRDCNSPPRDDHPLASRGVPVVLARAITQTGWQAENLGRAAQSRSQRSHAIVPGLAAIAGLADLPDQSCRWYRGNRPLRAADDNVPAALLPCDSASRTSTVWVSFGVTTNPTAEWISRQIIEAFPWDSSPRYLIRDRDTAYGVVFRQRLRAMGIRDKPTAPRSPWQNPYVERLIGTIRRECLDHVIVFGEAHLRRILGRYAAYYNGSRIHRSLDKDAPFHRAIERLGVITSRPVLGGLHHEYCLI